MIITSFRYISVTDFLVNYTIPGAPLWSRIINTALRNMAYYELQIPWFAGAEFRLYIAKMHLYLSGVQIGRSSSMPRWQPEQCMSCAACLEATR